MQTFRSGWARFAGQIIGWAAAYALVLNVVLAGLLGAQFAVHADGAPGFELCLTSSAGGSDPSAPPPDHGIGKLHCLLRTAGGSVAALPAPSVSIVPAVVGNEIALLTADDGNRREDPDHLSPPVRGPPLTA